MGGTAVAPDCAAPSISMNGDSFPRGCSGAVWKSGTPSRTYCQGSQGKYPWWAACCQWDEISSACIAKAPATQAPTTQAPTTQAPTTQAPTTQAPTIQAYRDVGEGFCNAFKELTRGGSIQHCFDQAAADGSCVSSKTISYGKVDGSRAKRCLCDTAENCAILVQSLQLGSDGFDRFELLQAPAQGNRRLARSVWNASEAVIV